MCRSARQFATVTVMLVAAGCSGNGSDGEGPTTLSAAPDARADAAPSGSEFVISRPGMTPISHRGSVELAQSADGSFAAIWHGIGAAGEDVYVRLFDATDQPRGDEFAVGAGERAREPAVAMDAAGNFIVAWRTVTEKGTGDDILFRRFDAGGNPLGSAQSALEYSGLLDLGPIIEDPYLRPGGSTFREGPTGFSLAMNPDGEFVLTWRRHLWINLCCLRWSNASLTPIDVLFARTFDVDGAPRSEPILVSGRMNTGGTVAMDHDGSFVVAWRRNEPLSRGQMNVRLRRYDAAGEAGPTETFSHRAVARYEIDMDAAGKHVVMRRRVGGPNPDVYIHRFDAESMPVGDPIKAVPGENESGRGVFPPRMAAAPTGNFALTWAERNFTEDDVRYSDVLLRCFAPDGTPQGEPFVVNETSVTIATSDTAQPTLAYDGFGDLIVAWHRRESDTEDIRARRFTDC